MCLGVVAIDVFSVCGGALLDRPCMVFQRVCVCCACDPNEHLSAPSICFVCVFVCQKLSPHLRAGSQVFALPILFICVILHTLGKRGPHLIHNILHEQILGVLHLQHLGFYFL